jgi:hypothetical protein
LVKKYDNKYNDNINEKNIGEKKLKHQQQWQLNSGKEEKSFSGSGNLLLNSSSSSQPYKQSSILSPSFSLSSSASPFLLSSLHNSPLPSQPQSPSLLITPSSTPDLNNSQTQTQNQRKVKKITLNQPPPPPSLSVSPSSQTKSKQQQQQQHHVPKNLTHSRTTDDNNNLNIPTSALKSIPVNFSMPAVANPYERLKKQQLSGSKFSNNFPNTTTTTLTSSIDSSSSLLSSDSGTNDFQNYQSQSIPPSASYMPQISVQKKQHVVVRQPIGKK